MVASDVTQDAYPPLLNPGEPFAYLPPNIAHQLHNFQYVACATLGMFVWEICYDLPNIYKLVARDRPTIPALVYLISRITTTLYNIFSLQFLIVGGDCTGLQLSLGVTWVLASASTTALFFIRICALYRDSRAVVVFFALLWISVIGGSLTVPLVLSGSGKRVAHLLPHESFCIDNGAYPAYAGAAMIIPAVFDTLVFLAISYRLFPSYEVRRDTLKERVGLFFTGDGLPMLSKALLQGGQKYYLISVVANIVALIVYFTPSIPTPYHGMISHPLISVINSMACKVYRDIKFGQIAGTLLAPSNAYPAGIPIPLLTAPRSQGGGFVGVDVSTTRDDSSVRRSESTMMERSDTGFKHDTEADTQV